MYELSSPDITKLAKAMLHVQSEITPATKDSRNPFVGNSYASLNSVMGVCSGLLLKNGILLLQLPVPAPVECGPGHLALMTKLVHVESGQWIASLICTPLPKSDPQGYGSALTYSRRYGLAAMLGIITEDDDGNAASYQSKQNKSQQRPFRNDNQRPPKENPTDSRCSLPPDIPQLDGVKYQVFPDENGREFVIASGNTLPKKEILQGAGFRWNPNDKVWWRYLNAA